MGGPGHRRRNNTDLARPHPTIEPCGIGVRRGHDSAFSYGSSKIDRFLYESAPDSLPHARGIDPNVLQTP
jgi:hypothetical protein